MKEDAIASIYGNMITEAKAPEQNKILAPGKVKPGELEGPTKVIQKKTGPAEADGFKKAEEAPQELSPLKGKTVTKENVNMEAPSFRELYDAVMKEDDQGLESPEFNDNAGDFPAQGDEMGAEGDVGGEPITVTLSPEQVDVLKDILSQIDGGAEGEMGPEGDMGPDGGEGEQVPPVGEAKSEPEPKEFNPSISVLQAPRKLGGKGVKVSAKKTASASAGSKKHTGELETAPAGVKPGDKGFMKVDGSGPAHTAKGASALED